ncbi:MAG: hypothetical protein AAF840_17190, partial [Bacteroidota bacterium]
FLLLSSCAATRTQVPVAVADFFIDPVGKHYRLLADDRLVTDNPLGQNQFEYFDSSLGAPDVVDVTNPFAILLYYADYGTVVVLDRTLSEVSRTDLFSLAHLRQPVTAARATDQGIWVFDTWDYRLKLMDAAGRPRLESNDLRLEIKASTEPAAIYVDQDRVLLHYAEEHKVAVFTNYGRFERWMELPEANTVGWYAPFLTGNNEVGDWIWDRRANKARPLVQGKVKSKVLATKDGFYHLSAAGQVTFTSFATERKE